jgi:hypothetical protein
VKTLQVFVRPTPASLVIHRAQFDEPTQFSLRWEAQAGVTYSVHKKPALDAPAWTNLGEVTATTNTAAFTDFQAFDSTSFYRVARP